MAPSTPAALPLRTDPLSIRIPPITHLEDGMRKLRLELDALAVETFETAAALAGAGTVRGNLRYTDAGGSGCPVDTCTCGETSCCPEPVTAPVPVGPVPVWRDSDCNATDGVCTCQPIETCSCAPHGTDVPYGIN